VCTTGTSALTWQNLLQLSSHICGHQSLSATHLTASIHQLSTLAHRLCNHRRKTLAYESRSFPPPQPPAFPYTSLSPLRLLVFPSYLGQRRSTLSRSCTALVRPNTFLSSFSIYFTNFSIRFPVHPVQRRPRYPLLTDLDILNNCTVTKCGHIYRVLERAQACMINIDPHLCCRSHWR
jgi:hypothetical protein